MKPHHRVAPPDPDGSVPIMAVSQKVLSDKGGPATEVLEASQYALTNAVGGGTNEINK